MPLAFHPRFRIESKGTFTADGTEQTLVEITRGVHGFSGYLDLSNLVSGDSVYVRAYVKIKSGGSYLKQGQRELTGSQSVPLLHILDYPTTPYGFKITIEQAEGTNRTYDYMFFSEEI